MSSSSASAGVLSGPLPLGLLCAAFFMGVLDSTSVFAALPSIGADLGMGPAGLSWVVTVYGLIVAGFMLPFGRIADIVGRRRVFIGAVVAFGLGSLACGAASSGTALIAARALQGLGAAALTPSALALLLSIFPEGAHRNRALGIWGGLGGIGATAGLVFGGLVTDLAGWSWIFHTNVPVCLLIVMLAPRVLPESRLDGPRRFNLASGLLLSIALMLVMGGLLEIPVSGWIPRTWILLAGAAGAAVVTVVVERRSDAPLLPPRLFRSRPLVVGNIVVFASGIAVNGLLALATIYAQQVVGLSPLLFGMTLAVMTVSSVLTVANGQRWVTRWGPRPVAATGLGVLAVTAASFTVLPGDRSGIPMLLGGLFVFGAGMGAAFVAGQVSAVSGIHIDDAGAASGLEETSFGIGCTLGVAIVTATALAFTGTADPTAPLTGLHAAFAALALISAAGGLVALTWTSDRRAVASRP